jgi:hypothetical protein
MANRETHGEPSKQLDASKKNPTKTGEPQDHEELIDETVWESFPASDAGASWAGRDIPPDERKKH